MIKTILSGKVVSSSSKDTAVVEVVTWKTHRLFRKRYKTNKRYLVHDPANSAELGQTVVISPCRPISKRKRWIISTPITVSPQKPKRVKKS